MSQWERPQKKHKGFVRPSSNPQPSPFFSDECKLELLKKMKQSKQQEVDNFLILLAQAKQELEETKLLVAYKEFILKEKESNNINGMSKKL